MINEKEKKDGGLLGTIMKIFAILGIIIGLFTYIYDIGEATRTNTQSINRNTYAIEKINLNNEDVRLSLNAIQINQKEQEVHLIYIRKLLDTENYYGGKNE
jgi:hypothetical protein